MRKILLSLLTLALALAATAQNRGAAPREAAPRPTTGSVDSLTMAVATVWADNLRAGLERNFKGDTLAIRMYTDGVGKALETNPGLLPYYLGVVEGIQLSQRLDQMEAMGVKADRGVFDRALYLALAGKQTMFTSGREADEFIHRVVMASVPVDTMDSRKEQAFLDEQFKRKSVSKTTDGLLFEVLKEGEGTPPSMSDRVRVMYTGQLSDGTVFDRTKEPLVFHVDRVVQGMQDGFLMMRPGGRYRLFIPPQLGYGEEGIQGIIPGNAVLDFTIELLDVLPPEEDTKPTE